MHTNLIEDTQYELSTLFEHGLAGSSRFAPRFDELSELYAQSGMGFAADKLKQLADLLRSSGFDVPKEAISLFAVIWEYLAIVTDRIWYYNAQKEVTHEISD